MKRSLPYLLVWVFCCLLSLSILSGCGGGGGSGDGGTGGGDAVDLSAGALTFNYSMGGTPPAVQTVTAWFGGAAYLEIGYPPGTSVPNWLTVRQADPGDNSSPLDIEFSINTYTVTAGTHQTTVRFVASNLDWSVIGYRDLRITCVASNQLGLDASEVDFTHTFSGADGPMDQSVSVYGDSIAWAASADQAWVVLDTTNGTTPSSLDIGIDPDGLDKGNHTATVTVRDTSSGHVETLVVNLTVEPHRLFIGDNGVALASFSTAPSVLSHTVMVADNAGTATQWSASSDQSWLAVTAAGVTDGLLTLAADPAGLAADTIHYATVTVGSNDPSISNTEQVKVGFYVAGSDPAVTDLSVSGASIAADPIRPYAYVTYGNSSTVDIFNIYTGEKVDSIVAGTTLQTMTISSDGAALYVYDADDETIVPIDLELRTVGGKWLDFEPGYLPYSRLNYARFNGRGVVLTSSRQVIDAADGTLAATIGRETDYDIVMAASPNDSSFYVIIIGLSGYSFDLERYAGHYSVINDTFEVTRSHRIATSYAARDIAVNEGGAKIYLSSPLRSFVFDGDSLVDGTVITDPRGWYVEIGPTDKLYVTAYDSQPIDVYSYNADDSADGTYSVQGDLYKSDIKISGDGLRMISLSADYASSYLSFTEISP